MSSDQLFCFPYAGGNAAFFDSIEKDLSDFHVTKLEYSGHGLRRKEPLYQSFDELAEDLYVSVKEQCVNENYALFGYSMGTISLVEVLRRIINRKEMPLPNHIFLAAHEPMTKAIFTGYPDEQIEDLVKARTIHFGTVPEKLVNNNSFWRMYIPLYTADYKLIGKYQFEKLDLKTYIPATVFYSETDTPYSDMMRWGEFFVGPIRYYKFEGNHFFIREHHEEMARILREEMRVAV